MGVSPHDAAAWGVLPRGPASRDQQPGSRAGSRGQSEENVGICIQVLIQLLASHATLGSYLTFPGPRFPSINGANAAMSRMSTANSLSVDDCMLLPPLCREIKSYPEKIFRKVSKRIANPHQGLLNSSFFLKFILDTVLCRLVLCNTFASPSLLECFKTWTWVEKNRKCRKCLLPSENKNATFAWSSNIFHLQIHF